MVDVQTTRRQEVLTADTVAAVPATRGYNAILAMIPSVNTSAFFNAGEQNNAQLSPGMTIFTSHGGRGNEGRVQVDGLNVGAAFNGGGVSGYIMDTAGAQELQFTLSGGLGEAGAGGINLNIVPKTGRQPFRRRILYEFRRRAGLKPTTLTTPASPWYHNIRGGQELGHQRFCWRSDQAGLAVVLCERPRFRHLSDRSGRVRNKNAGDPTKWKYVEDRTQEIRNDSAESRIGPLDRAGHSAEQGRVLYRSATHVRGSALATGSRRRMVPRTEGQMGGAWRPLHLARSGCDRREPSPQRVTQATWSSTVTSKLLLEAGFQLHQPLGLDGNARQHHQPDSGDDHRPDVQDVPRAGQLLL